MAATERCCGRERRAAATHLHDLLRARPHGLERPERVPECERRLDRRAAVHQLHGSGNETDLAGEVDCPVNLKQKFLDYCNAELKKKGGERFNCSPGS